ncbi:MAG: hypothetical protein ACTHZX_01175 [Microbacterium sp.]
MSDDQVGLFDGRSRVRLESTLPMITLDLSPAAASCSTSTSRRRTWSGWVRSWRAGVAFADADHLPDGDGWTAADDLLWTRDVAD